MPAKRYTLENFDPNKLEKGQPEWATFVPGRRTQFKLHSNRGLALNACNFGRTFVLYHWSNNEWVKVEHNRRVRADKCDLCAVPVDRGQYTMRPVWVFKKTRQPKFKFLCVNCRAGMENS
jgi:hypothetical protein